MAPKLVLVMRPTAGGMWQHLLTLLDGLGDTFEPVVCCQDDAKQLETLADRAVAARVVPLPARIEPVADIRAARLLRRIIRQERPSLVHSHGFHAGLVTSAVLPFAGRAPHVCTLHSMAVPPTAGRALRAVYRVLQRLLVASTSRIIAISEAVRHALPGGERARKIIVISNGVDPRQIARTMTSDEARAALGVDGKHVVGCVARLAPEKGVDDFVRMAAIASKADPSLAFVIVGDGPERARLEDLAEALSLRGRVTFAGKHFPASDFIQLFDITVVPSVSEGQSLVAMESMFLGTPVVATEVGGLGEVVTPEAGKLVPPRQPEALARAVGDMLESDQVARMGARGKEIADQRFTSRRMIEETRRVYEEMLSARRDR